MLGQVHLDMADADGYAHGMASKVTSRVEHLVAEAAQLTATERATLLEAIRALPAREETVPARHAVIAARAARVHAGDAATLSLDEVESGVRDELDF